MSDNSNVLDHLMDLNKVPLNFNAVILKLSGKNVLQFTSLSHQAEILSHLIDCMNRVATDFNSHHHQDMKPQRLNNLLKDLVEEKLQSNPVTSQTHKLKGNGYPHLEIQLSDSHLFLSLTAAKESSTDAFRALYIYPAESEDEFRVQSDGAHLRMKFEYNIDSSNYIVISNRAISDLFGLELTTKIELNASNSECFDPTRLLYRS